MWYNHANINSMGNIAWAQYIKRENVQLVAGDTPLTAGVNSIVPNAGVGETQFVSIAGKRLPLRGTREGSIVLRHVGKHQLAILRLGSVIAPYAATYLSLN